MLWSGWSWFFHKFLVTQVFFSRPLETGPNEPTTIGITVTFIFYDCFNSLARSKHFFRIFFIFFDFLSMVHKKVGFGIW